MSQNTSQHPFSIPESGKLFVPMTNDYLFRALLQKNNYVLKGLLCSLLHLNASEVASVTITNPIQLGEAIDDKEFILDINVDLIHCGSSTSKCRSLIYGTGRIALSVICPEA